MLIVTDGYTTNKRDTQTEESEQWNTKNSNKKMQKCNVAKKCIFVKNCNKA